MTAQAPYLESVVGPEVAAIEAALRQRIHVPDVQFDRLYPRMQRFRSGVHWTPVDVAMRVAELLASAPGGHILDVGSGVGKACIVGALTTSTTWHGVELSTSMVRSARNVARRLGVEERTRFVEGDVLTLDCSVFGGFYLYNPFAEALFKGKREQAARRTAFLDEVEAVERKLATTRPGTHVVTYHGFGGDLSEDFELVECEKIGQDEVCLWIRV
jgi:SAM-dependent methyltransferase